jgi:hypothetical protein
MRRPRWLQRKPPPYVLIPAGKWETIPCPRCGLVIGFWPGQPANVCGHCQTLVARGLG